MCILISGSRSDFYFQDDCTDGPTKPDPSVADQVCTCDKLVTAEEWGPCTCKEVNGVEVCEQFKATTCVSGTPAFPSATVDCTKYENTNADSQICQKPDPYTLWTEWSACTPDCTAENDATERVRTRTRECKNTDGKDCDEKDYKETEACSVNVCQTCSAFANYCADRPNAQCVDVEENGVTKATCQCRPPYK